MLCSSNRYLLVGFKELLTQGFFYRLRLTQDGKTIAKSFVHIRDVALKNYWLGMGGPLVTMTVMTSLLPIYFQNISGAGGPY